MKSKILFYQFPYNFVKRGRHARYTSLIVVTESDLRHATKGWVKDPIKGWKDIGIQYWLDNIFPPEFVKLIEHAEINLEDMIYMTDSFDNI